MGATRVKRYDGGSYRGITITVLSREIANKIVDEIYGPNDGTREPNDFYIDYN